jgi:hypothetical protein
MRIVTLFSDKIYQQHAENLAKSAKKFGEEVHLNYFKLNSWPDISTAKVRLLLMEYRKHGGPLLYLDADCELIKPLGGFHQKIENHDLSIRCRYLIDRYNAGVIGLGTNRQVVIPFLERFLALCNSNAKNHPTLEQKVLETVVDTNKPRLKIYDIPYKYNFVPGDDAEYDPECAIIMHHKMSRTNSKIIAWRKTFPENKKKYS